MKLSLTPKTTIHNTQYTIIHFKIALFPATDFEEAAERAQQFLDAWEGPRNEAGKRHGVGKMTMPMSGNVYEGTYTDDKKHGKGRMTYTSGDFYEGDWYVVVRGMKRDI